MATAAQIESVKLNIDITNDDFSDAIISAKIDEKSSVNWACWQLLEILKVRLRKKMLKRDVSGNESTEVHSLAEQIRLYDSLIKKYKDDYNADVGSGTGVFVGTVKPTIAGGDV